MSENRETVIFTSEGIRVTTDGGELFKSVNGNSGIVAGTINAEEIKGKSK